MRGAAAEGDGDDHAGEGDEGGGGFEGGAVGVAADAAIGGLQKLLKLAEEDGETEIEDDPFGVGFADVGDSQQAGGGQVVECAAE